MARYNRDFLVPYLQNICALHLARCKVSGKISNMDSKIRQLERGEDIHEPSIPHKLKVVTAGRVLSIIAGVLITLLMGFGLLMILLEQIAGIQDYDLWMYLIFLLAIAVGLGMFLEAIDLIKKDIQENEQNMNRYKQSVATYNSVKQKNIQSRQHIPTLQSEINKLYKELNRVDILLKRSYSINIIPSHYRGIYPAIYLYDWFSTSRADDLDMALNMFVLEEIKEKLDRIIANQMDMILNQCMMLANQQRSLEQQQKHSAMMRSKLNQIAASAEERNTYLSMIECNTAATAYFAAADYIRHL